jgi:hypothetical protein
MVYRWSVVEMNFMIESALTADSGPLTGEAKRSLGTAQRLSIVIKAGHLSVRAN